MDGTKKYLYRAIVNIIIVVIEVCSFAFLWINYLNSNMQIPFKGKGHLLILVFYLIISVLCFAVMKAFQICVEKLSIIMISQTIALCMTNFLSCLVVMLMIGNIDKLGIIAGAFLLLWSIQVGITLFISFVITNHYAQVFPPHRILHIYGQYENNLPRKMSGRRDKYLIADSISCDEPLETIMDRLRDFDAALLNDIPVAIRNKIVKQCYSKNIRVYTTPKISDIIIRKSVQLNLFDSPLYLCRNRGLTIDQKLWKRILDLYISLFILVITSPIFILTAVAIKLDDGGPVFFKQERYTLDRKKFWILKFRSMIVNAEADGKANPAADNDSRITKVGHFIRATRIDELPQLINILKGEMSFVGPRAERVEHVDKYCEALPEFELRLKVKAGLTGYAQIYGRYNTSPYDKLKLDMIYIMNYSLLMDLQIIFQTLKVIFIKESTMGFDDEQREKVRN